jgi:hypothetical protein
MQSIDEFVHSRNVENLRRQLNADLDQDKRRVLLALLAEEEGKLHICKTNGWRFDQDRFARPRVRQA